MKHAKYQLRIGIYVGTFDPVHAGHVAFALQVLEAAGLDEVIFLPERRPLLGRTPEHFAHRITMLQSALAPHPRLSVMEMVYGHFSLRRTVPHLRSLFPDASLVFLMGTDAVSDMVYSPYADVVLDNSELVVSVSSDQQQFIVEQLIETSGINLRKTYLIMSCSSAVSSSKIRDAIRSGVYTSGLLASVQRYARQEWLYVSPSHRFASVA